MHNCITIFSLSVMLQVLYKLKTAKMFDKPKKSQDGQDDDPFAIQIIYLLQDSRMMCIAGATHCILFRFSKQESNIEIPVSGQVHNHRFHINF